ncbi:MAG: dihydroorotate dehydrogenase electron transfer subunit [Calditrichaeota bacterium]|nr:dihydroorotate dehydrogenase electron transfer subunit [Calditrichota bacterium]MBT7788291.1 dihydroorotate dehydrogenase electron transfer subunit [Calditrichota bacterium]
MIQFRDIMQPVSEACEIISNTETSTDTWEMTVETKKIASECKPGQFVHVRTGSGFNPFLRRPLSIGPCNGNRLRLIFIVRGEGTRLLAEMQAGEFVDLVGPLGNPYQLPDNDEVAILVGGGIGVVPLLILSDYLSQEKENHFLLGVRSHDLLPVLPDEIELRGIEVASDDGSIGFKGLVTNLLESKLNDLRDRSVRIYGCGPEPMTRAIKEICMKRKVPAQVSLEVPMGCGVGACQSCAVLREDGVGYLLVCKDGPVFDINDVDLTPGGSS